MKHIKIQPFITDEEKERLLKEEGFYAQPNTQTGGFMTMNFKSVEFRGIERVALMKLFPNTDAPLHTDKPRDCIIIHPLSDNYAPCETDEGKIYGPCIIDVKNLKHGVFNNDETRINLQINCQMLFSSNLDDYRHLPIDLRLA